mgnify:CR=1 FL=1
MLDESVRKDLEELFEQPEFKDFKYTPQQQTLADSIRDMKVAHDTMLMLGFTKEDFWKMVELSFKSNRGV